MPVSPSLRIGACAPDFSLPDPATGTCVALSDFTGRDVLIVFFRGTWCPFCREQMRLLSDQEAPLRQAKIAIIGVVCQNAITVGKYARDNQLSFTLLADEQRQLAKAYGVHYWLSLDGVNLAHPALFILDRSGIITFAHVGRNMRDLPLQTVLQRFLSFLNPSEADSTSA